MPSRKKKAEKKGGKASGRIKKQPGTQFYERRLTIMRNDLMKLVQEKQQKEMPDLEVGDEADAATQSSERELLFELSDTERQTLDAIEAALRKIEQGRFGLCESCHKKILRTRLRAMPQARYCINCQARFERPRF
ncbi:MAG TPA: TraR/DksA family transcriptional regulator [Elusimicrobiota bacterium]|nr:TraR/DksA family transcriptional regulator [Elusimicrobiota bacterium]